MKISKKIISMLLLTPFLAFAQTKHQKAIQRSLANKSVEISEDTVFYSGEAWFTAANSRGSAIASAKELKTLSQKTVAIITKAFNGTYGITSTFFIEFPGITAKA